MTGAIRFAAALGIAAALITGCSSAPSCHHVSKKCRAVMHNGQVEYFPIVIPIYHPYVPPEDPVEPVSGGDG